MNRQARWVLIIGLGGALTVITAALAAENRAVEESGS
jgi:hypothetical protein